MQIEEHTANVEVYLENETIHSEILTYRVLEKGSLIKKGILLGIKNKQKAHVNEEIWFEPLLQNTGESSFYAKFRGKIYFNETLVEEIESDKYYVIFNKTATLPFNFTLPPLNAPP